MRRVLVICMRRIGDVLLATPVAGSIKAAWPDAAIDMLVFAGTEGVLRGNPDIATVIAGARVHVGRCDAAPCGPALAALRRRDLGADRRSADVHGVGGGPAIHRPGGSGRAIRVEAMGARRCRAAGADAEHTVAGNLRLLSPLHVPPKAAVRATWDEEAPQRARAVFPEAESARFALMHVSPKFAYKAWTAEGWTELAQWLTGRGLTVVIAGGGSQEERDSIAALMPRLPAGTIDISGKVDLAALAWLIHRAQVYVGTDTAVTHIAAALGVPTVALFGPSSPVKWGPWPRTLAAGAATPWLMRGAQQRGNVYLLQGEDEDGCVPCLGEGCDKHVASLSDCLRYLPAQRVIEAVERMLSSPQGGVHITIPS
jgi:heptosyltransferase-3